jgi:predicted RecA/RadA family phage recombinase
MKTFVQDGDLVTVAAPYDVASGAGALVGTLFGVANGTALSGADVVLSTLGVFDLAKAASQAWTVGAAIYWDNSAKNCTTTSSGNTLIGKALLAVGSGAGETTGRVRLNG